MQGKQTVVIMRKSVRFSALAEVHPFSRASFKVRDSFSSFSESKHFSSLSLLFVFPASDLLPLLPWKSQMSRYLFGFIYKKIFVYLETTYFSSSHF
jgi:hypothetical protein